MKLEKGSDIKLLVNNDFSDVLSLGTSIGLPEYNDRTKEWRVALIYNSEGIGFIYYNAITGVLNSEKTTSINLFKQRISDLGTKKNKKKKVDKTYHISQLNNMLINGDSLIELKKIPENSIDMVFTSPPYFNAKTEYSEFINYESYLNFINKIIKEIDRILIPGKFFIMNSSPVLLPRIDRQHSSTRLAVPYDIHGLFMKNDYEFIDDIYWKKPEGAGWSAGRGRRFSADRNPMQYKPVPVTENIMVYRKKSDKLIDWFIRKHPQPDIIERSKVPDGYEKTNVWEINPAKDRRHPAIFPLELAEKVIQYYSFENDVILDPFGGLATTAKAALNLDRRFVSIELDKNYFKSSLNDFNKDYAMYMPNIEVVNNKSK